MKKLSGKELGAMLAGKAKDALSDTVKRSELMALNRQMDKVTPVMEELELLMDEYQVCDQKLRELNDHLAHPSPAARLPIVAQLTRQPDPAELKSQIAAYSTMRAGVEGHMLQLVRHQCKDFSFLGSYLYPVAVGEISRYLEDGAAEDLHTAIGLYEDQLERWRETGSEGERLRKAQWQAEYMAKLLKVIND
ncbi:MAG: hypothetical protein LUG64_08575 [Clostridiales bacterium]|nr:hypothetical protein [Clostridiales bacterium]